MKGEGGREVGGSVTSSAICRKDNKGAAHVYTDLYRTMTTAVFQWEKHHLSSRTRHVMQ